MTNFPANSKPHFEPKNRFQKDLEPPKINKSAVKSAIREIIEKNKAIEESLNLVSP